MSTLTLPLLLILLCHFPHASTALPVHRPPLPPPGTATNADALTTYFEVTKPISRPKTKPCSYLLLRHDFGYTYGSPPVLAAYSPPNPADCPAEKFSSVILRWRASSKGRQFDRIFGVWLGGVELLRGCTAEPRPNGIAWEVEKDITRYSSLLKSNQTLAVYLGNLVTTTYTGIYHVEISIHFYPFHSKPNPASGYEKWADLIQPISRELPLNDGLWFEIENSTDIKSKEFKIPPNVYKAVLEIFVSFHENDEFWYSNLPNDYIAANNLSTAQSNGPFREVFVTLDDDDTLVGAVWPFTVIYTGGLNPLLWRPITGIGSFDLPTYDIELTPFLGKLLDGRKHKIRFGVTNALNVWYIDANLHLWLDEKSPKTVAMLLNHHGSGLHSSIKSSFVGLDGTFDTKMSRVIASVGWVKSSHGKIITSFRQDLGFSNSMIIENNGNVQIVNQTIESNTSVFTKTSSSHSNMILSHKRFPLYLYMAQIDQGNNDYIGVTNITLGFNDDRIYDSLKNSQDATAVLVVQNGYPVGGSGNTRQVYEYDSCVGACYLRNVSSSNYAIVYDTVSTKCNHKLEMDDPSSLSSLL